MFLPVGSITSRIALNSGNFSASLKRLVIKVAPKPPRPEAAFLVPGAPVKPCSLSVIERIRSNMLSPVSVPPCKLEPMISSTVSAISSMCLNSASNLFIFLASSFVRLFNILRVEAMVLSLPSKTILPPCSVLLTIPDIKS